MILLEIDIRNANVALTLSERTTLENAFYLFEVWNTQNPAAKQYFTAPDTSDYPESYNKFSLKAISSGSPNTATGEFLALQTDFWNYKVYEQVVEGNLDPTDLDVVETGIIRIEGSAPEVSEFDQETTNILYGS